MFDLSNLISPIRQDIKDLQSGAIKTWSPTDIQIMNQCLLRLYKKKVLKHYGKQSPEGKRGDEFHTGVMEFIKGDSGALPAIKGHEDYICGLQELYFDHADKMHMEEKWGFNTDWSATGWNAPDVWAKMKLDLMYFESDTCAAIDDWKTGKKFGNEAKHRLQGQAYTIGTFMKYPQLELIKTSFRYLDLKSDNTLSTTYTRDSIAPLISVWTNKAIAMTSMTDFPPSPSASRCEYCEFRPWGDDVEPHMKCVHGVCR